MEDDKKMDAGRSLEITIKKGQLAIWKTTRKWMPGEALK